MFIDTHTHIYTEEFSADREEVVQRAMEAGAVKLLLPNIDERSIGQLSDLCEAHPGLCLPMMGLHPTELPPNPDSLLQRMEKMLAEEENPYVAIGEVGIDLYWDSSCREKQIEVFRQQANWAVRYHLPLMIHARSAHREIIDTLLPMANDLTGVFHCFGGTAEEAHELLSLFPGFVLGIGGIVTFKKSKLPAVLHAEVPSTRIVVETDAPYLAPHPYRGKRNEPSFLPLVIAKLAEIYDMPVRNMENELLATTSQVFPAIRAKDTQMV